MARHGGVRKVSGGYVAVSKSGHHLSKHPGSRHEAVEQVKAVKASQARRKGKGK